LFLCSANTHSAFKATKPTITMIKRLTAETWKPFTFPGHKLLLKHYALSSAGRIASYKQDIFKDGKLIKGSRTTGYNSMNLHRNGYGGTLYVHREIAKLFLKRPSSKHIYVIHKNHNKPDNAVKNLKWATKNEMIAHQQKSPVKIAYHERQANLTKGLKLTASQVRAIKAQLSNTNRKLTIKQIADKYGVSEMTIYRIKSGVNWGRV
jgi:hypothetical protein